jgi:murein DD-endopeptidase MepM/ murein hydrolase activator NlpD
MTYGIVYALTESELQKEIDINKQEIQKLEDEIKAYSNKISNTKEEAATLKEAIKRLTDSKTVLEKELSINAAKKKNSEMSIEETVAKISDTESRIKLLVSGINESLKQFLYLGNDSNNYVLFMIDAQNVLGAVDRMNESSDYRSNLSNSVNILNDTRQNLQNNKLVYEAEVSNLKDIEYSLQNKKIAIENNKKETSNLLNTTKQKESEYQKILAQRKKQKTELEKEINDFESKIKSLVNSSNLPKSGNGVLGYPVKNVNVTQYFGNTPFSTQNPQVYNGAGHNGIDFAVSVGSNIYSSADGVVIGVGNSDIACAGASYGKWILIKHDNGLSTLYAHLSSQLVSEGQSVTRGQIIAASGNTGYSTGPHLHFTVYASDGVKVAGPTEYKSKTCGTYMRIPLAPRNAYLNPLTYL